MNEELQQILLDEGYTATREIEGLGVCGINRMAYTIGLFINLDETGYEYRYCFSNSTDALCALIELPSEPENFIVRKGLGPDKHPKTYKVYTYHD